jgi:hypothetical protein
MPRLLVQFVLAVPICLAGVPVAAQDAAADPPAHISFVDGAAVLERDGRTDHDLASMPLLAGDRLRTEGGRVEVLFADGSTLHLDATTLVDFLSDDVVRLLEGRIRVSIAGPARDVSYRVDAPSAWVQIADPGEYRISVTRDAEVELAVLRGAAELVNEQGRSYIRAGERTFARAGAAPSPPYVFNSAAWDSFDRWSEARRDQRLGVSAQYLPNDVRPYAAAFDAYGDWRYEQAYGYVWYPRAHVGWRPYSRGRWVSLRPYGWTWIAADPWGWPTHHYGRWGISAGAWFWIPGRHWGPAWVSWAYAPGYVSWCPLGWNNRPVLQIVNVNVFGGRRYDPWHAWTVLPRHHFGRGFVTVNNHVTVRVDARTRGRFVVQDRAPSVRYAVGRAAPIRSAGRYAVPRPGTAPAFASRPAGAEAGAPDGSRASRGFPAPARAPGTPSAGLRSGGAAEPPPAPRAVARTPAASPGGDPSRAGDAGQRARRGASTEYPAAPGRATGARESGGSPVTAAPDGAVRAVPRVRQVERSTAAPGRREGVGIRQDRQQAPSPAPPVTRAPGGAVRAVPRVRQSEPAPAYAPPQARPDPGPLPRPGGSNGRIYRRGPDAPAPSPSGGVDRPAYRRSPEAAAPGGPPSGIDHRRSAPRAERPPAAPEYRRVPERRAPAGPPPASAGPSRSSGEGGARGRQRSTGAPSGGGARRRN